MITKRYRVEFEVEADADMTEEQVKEWVSFNLKERACMTMTHESMGSDMEAAYGSVYVRGLA